MICGSRKFAVGKGAQQFISLSQKELKETILSELDEMFEGKASATYVKHISQNWNAELFAKGAYIIDQEKWRKVRTLGEPVGDKLYFAGDAYTDGEDWGSVHMAAQSAIRAVKSFLPTKKST